MSTELNPANVSAGRGRPRGLTPGAMRCRTAMFITRDMKTQLGIIARREQVSESEIVRRCITHGLSNDAVAVA